MNAKKAEPIVKPTEEIPEVFEIQTQREMDMCAYIGFETWKAAILTLTEPDDISRDYNEEELYQIFLAWFRSFLHWEA